MARPPPRSPAHARTPDAVRTAPPALDRARAPLHDRSGGGGGGDDTTQTRRRILFYHAHAPHYGFTNFSPDRVVHAGRVYPTSEHLYQALKFLPHRPELAEHMRTCSARPRAVFDEAHRFSPEVRPDWLKLRVESMDLALSLKFTQNAHLKDELLLTGDAELVEDSDGDAFWGVGPDGKGENQLGKALQRLRTKLQDTQNTAVLSRSSYR